MISKKLDILLLINYFIFPLIGWHFGGILIAIAGLLIAYLVDIFAPKWKHELTWQDIDIALKNIYKHGKNPCELCFQVGERRVYIYRDEKGDEDDPIRMAVRIPLKDWSDIYNKEDFSQLMNKFGYMGIYSKNRGPEAYVIFTSNGADDCKEILKTLFERSVGGLRPDIYARSVVNAKKNIWIDHSEEEIKKPGRRKSNANP
jgi:hypothetical protein